MKELIKSLKASIIKEGINKIEKLNSKLKKYVERNKCTKHLYYKCSIFLKIFLALLMQLKI